MPLFEVSDMNLSCFFRLFFIVFLGLSSFEDCHCPPKKKLSRWEKPSVFPAPEPEPEAGGFSGGLVGKEREGSFEDSEASSVTTRPYEGSVVVTPEEGPKSCVLAVADDGALGVAVAQPRQRRKAMVITQDGVKEQMAKMLLEAGAELGVVDEDGLLSVGDEFSFLSLDKFYPIAVPGETVVLEGGLSVGVKPIAPNSTVLVDVLGGDVNPLDVRPLECVTAMNPYVAGRDKGKEIYKIFASNPGAIFKFICLCNRRMGGEGCPEFIDVAILEPEKSRRLKEKFLIYWFCAEKGVVLLMDDPMGEGAQCGALRANDIFKKSRDIGYAAKKSDRFIAACNHKIMRVSRRCLSEENKKLFSFWLGLKLMFKFCFYEQAPLRKKINYADLGRSDAQEALYDVWVENNELFLSMRKHMLFFAIIRAQHYGAQKNARAFAMAKYWNGFAQWLADKRAITPAEA